MIQIDHCCFFFLFAGFVWFLGFLGVWSLFFLFAFFLVVCLLLGCFGGLVLVLPFCRPVFLGFVFCWVVLGVWSLFFLFAARFFWGLSFAGLFWGFGPCSSFLPPGFFGVCLLLGCFGGLVPVLPFCRRVFLGFVFCLVVLGVWSLFFLFAFLGFLSVSWFFWGAWCARHRKNKTRDGFIASDQHFPGPAAEITEPGRSSQTS